MKSKKSGREILYWVVKRGDVRLMGSSDRPEPAWTGGTDFYSSRHKMSAQRIQSMWGKYARVVAVVRKEPQVNDEYDGTNGSWLMRKGAEKGAAEERAAIVTYLADRCGTWVATAIERGDHLRTRNGSGPTPPALTCTPANGKVKP